MKKPIQSGGGAMSGLQGPEADGSIDLVDFIMDAQNLLSEIKFLNEAIFLAAHGLGDRAHMNAITAVADIIEKKLLEVQGLLDTVREAH